jgi:hypothetical protein
MKTNRGENGIMTNLTACIPHRTLLGRPNQRGWGGWDMRHAWGRGSEASSKCQKNMITEPKITAYYKRSMESLEITHFLVSDHSEWEIHVGWLVVYLTALNTPSSHKLRRVSHISWGRGGHISYLKRSAPRDVQFIYTGHEHEPDLPPRIYGCNFPHIDSCTTTDDTDLHFAFRCFSSFLTKAQSYLICGSMGATLSNIPWRQYSLGGLSTQQSKGKVVRVL